LMTMMMTMMMTESTPCCSFDYCCCCCCCCLPMTLCRVGPRPAQPTGRPPQQRPQARWATQNPWTELQWQWQI
jgi:hypothetical protein